MALMLTLGLLPSSLKAIAYRLMGYRIGKKTKIGFGSIIVGKDVKVGNDVNIGFMTVIRGRIIRIGSHVSIGSTSIIDTPYISIGDGSKINEQVFVGGMEFPDSKFELGKNTIVMQMTYINTAKPVVIGDDSGIGGHCIIFSHGSWLSEFEGYPVKFAPVEIGRSVWLPWRVFVMPGARIGDGSVIGANSMVAGEIPERCLAAGSPAKVIRQPPDFPRSVSNVERIRILERILSEMCAYLEFYRISGTNNGNIWRFTEHVGRFIGKTRNWNMVVDLGKGDKKRHVSPLHLFLSLPGISQQRRREMISQETMWIDIENKERSSVSNELGEEVTLFLKRYGVRLTYVA